jgi:hypothetical protein
MPTLPIAILAAAFLLASAAGCSSAEVDPPDSAAAALPLLAPGFTLGTTLYGSADLGEVGAAERALLDDAVARGLGGFTYYVDWEDLEPEPGRYTLDAFVATLDGLRALGVAPFVNITIGDSGSYNLPDGIGDGAGGIADGVALDDAAVVERFGALVERVAPLVVERGGFFLGLGNEMGEYLDPSRDDREAYVRLFEAARDRIRAVEPRLAVGVALTNHAVRERTPTFRAFRAVADVVAFNHAPIRPDFLVRDVDDVRSDLREVVTAYGDGPILLQELTCPSPETMGASEAWQRACFEALFAEVAATPRIRFASVFTFQDFDEPTCEIISDALLGSELDDLPEEIAQRLRDYFCFLGVVAPDGTPKPAWGAVLAAAESIAE